jgi:cytochrome c peroxidase
VTRSCNPSSYPAIGLVAALVFAGAAPESLAQTQSGKVVDAARYTSPYDAFMKMNRLPEAFNKGDNGADYWGYLESRLGNQAGRILIKRPAKGFPDDAFRGWLMFIRAYGNSTGIGNCAECHRIPDFTDHAKHNIGTAKQPVDTPSLRGLAGKKKFFHDGSASTLEGAIQRHVDAAQTAQQDKRSGVEVEVGKIALTEREVREVAAFLRALEPVPRDQFRQYLIDVVVQPVELDFSD